MSRTPGKKPLANKTGSLSRKEGRKTLIRQEEFKGPLPHPELYAQYEKICPGAAKDILEYTKSEQKFRHEAVASEFGYRRLGMFFAFLLCLVSIGGAVYLASIDQLLVASMLVGVTITGIVGAFIQKRHTSE